MEINKIADIVITTKAKVPTSTDNTLIEKKVSELSVSNFEIIEQTREQWCEIRNLVQKWRICAEQKFNETKNDTSINEDLKKEMLRIYSASHKVFSFMYTVLPKSSWGRIACTHRCDAVLIAKKSDEIQSVAIFSEKTNSIVYFGTNPDNIHGVNNPGRIKGAGTALILHIIQKTLTDSLSSPISVIEPLGVSKSFYERFGFVDVPDSDPQKMQLTFEKVRELISQKAHVYQGITLPSAS